MAQLQERAYTPVQRLHIMVQLFPLIASTPALLCGLLADVLVLQLV